MNLFDLLVWRPISIEYTYFHRISCTVVYNDISTFVQVNGASNEVIAVRRTLGALKFYRDSCPVRYRSFVWLLAHDQLAAKAIQTYMYICGDFVGTAFRYCYARDNCNNCGFHIVYREIIHGEAATVSLISAIITLALDRMSRGRRKNRCFA